MEDIKLYFMSAIVIAAMLCAIASGIHVESSSVTNHTIFQSAHQ